MKPEEKLALIGDAYKTKKVDDEREQIHIINDELPEKFHEAILNIQFKLNEETGTFELDYDIMNDATGIIADNCTTPKELEEADFYEHESASVYTSTRLGYLHANNQQDVSDILHEFGKETDIATACAVWYDRQVTRACELLREFIMEDDSESV